MGAGVNKIARVVEYTRYDERGSGGAYSQSNWRVGTGRGCRLEVDMSWTLEVDILERLLRGVDTLESLRLEVGKPGRRR